MTPGACTHKPLYSSDKTKVEKCKGTQASLCPYDSECVLNYVEQPSKEPGVCTHLSSWNGDEKLVSICK